MSMCCSRRWVAKLCRRVCSDTGFSSSAMWAAAWQARLSWRVVSGAPSTRPGNSQPCGCPTCHQSRIEQLRRQHHIAILAALALLHADDHALAVDVRGLERYDLGRAQASPIRHAERRLVVE